MTAAGKRQFDDEGNRKLIEACLQPGASIAGLAFTEGWHECEPAA
jgi:transposase